jgi:ABC-2 type transport system ATP-binding protein
VSLQVGRGQVFGLLGPNGAGKSTLVKIMMTVVSPTRCTGSLLGAPVGDKPTLARVGYLPENHRFPKHLTGRQTLHFFAALAKCTRPQRTRRINELLDLVGMTNWADRRVGMYSKGMMQRIGLAQALANDPDLVLLDEPTDGVDPVGRRDIRDVLIGMKQRGKTIFLNSHLLSELEMICDRVAIMVAGRVVSQGTMDELAMTRQHYAIELHAPVEPTTIDLLRTKLSDGISASLSENTLKIETMDAVQIQPAIDLLRAQGAVIRRVHMIRPSLEDLFIEAVGATRPGAARTGATNQ